MTLVVVAVVLLVAWFVLHALTPADVVAKTKNRPDRIPVVVGVAEQVDAPNLLSAIGTVQAFNSVLVRSRVDGALEKVVFQEGQYVHAGDLLAQIDARPFEAQLHAVLAQKAHDESQLANVERDVERYTYLASQKIYPQQQLDGARAQAAQLKATVAMDQAQIDNARIQLGYTSIRAPIDGLTGARLVDAGNMVHATDTNGLVLITQVHPIYVSFTLPQDALPALLSERQRGTVTVIASNRDASQVLDQGALSLIDNQIDPSTGTIHCKATFKNGREMLWPGQFVSLKVVLAVQHDAVTVPSTAVQQGENGTYVFVVSQDQTAELRKVAIGPTNDGQSVVEQGLSKGDRVVVEGQFKLEDGSPVSAVDHPHRSH
ncbi:efflux RND transporter periplasmic adaptor subunit [Dyella flagellata]|uniref:efflux RND transporter periplasmic adaptor subunit n=1 Tax=Dyella flagellata TaxID=1867833 RepID=UPI0024E1772D|nr:efflux RND transporter periplasmic adaptor subunit [Dyella flagellata]